MKRSQIDEQVLEPTILIVEDHEAVRASLLNLLGAAFTDCRFLEAKTGEEAIALVSAHRPEIVLMDIGLPKITGIEATRRVKAEVPTTMVVVISIHEAPNYRADADAAGANAFILKSEIPSKLIPLIKELLSELSDQTSGD
jgi:DNA-binding NarL/FixJ family response regulator